MPINTVIFCAANGGGFIYLFVLGIIMLITKKSIFSDVEPRFALRRAMGFTLILWGLSYLNGVSILALDFSDVEFAENLNLVMDLSLSAPITIHLFYLITHMGKPTYRWLIFDTLAGTALFIAYMVLKSDIALYITLTFWLIRAAQFTWFFTRKTYKYNQALENDLSDHSNLDVSWLQRAVWFLGVYIVAYMASGLLHSNILWLSAFIFLLAIWSYVFYYVDTQRAIPNIKALQLLQQEQEQATSEPETPATAINPNNIALRLKMDCEDKLLYLQPGLTITDLAEALGTNRTYLWKHFKNVGTNFHAYINTLRINYAKRLMLETPNPNITKISAMSGFGSDASFRRVFADYYGCSPTQYIAANKEDSTNQN